MYYKAFNVRNAQNSNLLNMSLIANFDIWEKFSMFGIES